MKKIKGLNRIFVALAGGLIGSLAFSLVVTAQISGGFGISAGNFFKLITGEVVSTQSSNYSFGLEMAAPSNTTSSASNGGSLATSTDYFYVVTSLDGAGGESLASSETSTSTDSTNRTITVSWDLVPGAAGYRVYRATSTQGYTTTSLLATNTTSTATSYVDGGTVSLSAGSPPTEATALVSKVGTSTPSWFLASGLGIGTTTPNGLLGVATSSGEMYLKVTFDGKVGISTSTPGEALTVGGKVLVKDNNASTTVQVGDSGQSGCLIIGFSDGSGVLYITASSTSNDWFATTTKPAVCN